MGRPPICTCGVIALWEPSADSARTSQMLTDWYSPSHIVHGLLFYGAAWLASSGAGRSSAASCSRLVVEAAWEMVENTPMVIDRYREATIALGYTGDIVINSVSDIAHDGDGLPRSPAACLCGPASRSSSSLELVALIVIRDNLTLNIIMLLAPNDAIRAWQAG